MKEMILFFHSSITFLILPKRLFAGRSELQYLQEQLTRNNVPNTGKNNKSISLNWVLVYFFLFIAILAILYLNSRSLPR